MTEIETLQTVTAIIQDIGIWAVFAWLFVQERKDHRETTRDRIDDLRMFSGIRQNISQTPFAPPPLPENPQKHKNV